MNERIKQLAVEAALTIDTTRGNTYVSHPEFNKKFAELIVRECCDLLETSLPYNPQQKMIKKHFGVEE